MNYCKDCQKQTGGFCYKHGVEYIEQVKNQNPQLKVYVDYDPEDRFRHGFLPNYFIIYFNY